MARTTKNSQLRFEIERPTLDNRTFTGCLYDTELNVNAEGYLFQYRFYIKTLKIIGDRCVVDADFCVAARADIGLQSSDLYKEIADLKKEYEKYQKLAQVTPNEVAMDGLTNIEIAHVYGKMLSGLESVKEPILNQIKLQIKDRLNSDERIVCGQVDMNVITYVPCNKIKPSGEGIRWKQVS